MGGNVWRRGLGANDRDELASWLDGLSHEERLHAVWKLPRVRFRDLFDLTAAAPALSPVDFVPRSQSPFKPVIYDGVNNMPMFRSFQKPMYRDHAEEIGGRNVQVWSWLTGPGYFRVVEEDGAAVFDYVDLPQEAPPSWPPITSNGRGFSRMVFHDLKDNVHRVARDVVIGEAMRAGKHIGQYFILVRRP